MRSFNLDWSLLHSASNSLIIATAILILGSLLVGVWSDNVMEKYWGAGPRTVVIDEFFGTWVACLAALGSTTWKVST